MKVILNFLRFHNLTKVWVYKESVNLRVMIRQTHEVKLTTEWVYLWTRPCLHLCIRGQRKKVEFNAVKTFRPLFKAWGRHKSSPSRIEQVTCSSLSSWEMSTFTVCFLVSDLCLFSCVSLPVWLSLSLSVCMMLSMSLSHPLSVHCCVEHLESFCKNTLLTSCCEIISCVSYWWTVSLFISCIVVWSIVETTPLNITGHVGGEVNFTCSDYWLDTVYQRYTKYLCKNPCHTEEDKTWDVSVTVAEFY